MFTLYEYDQDLFQKQVTRKYLEDIFSRGTQLYEVLVTVGNAASRGKVVSQIHRVYNLHVCLSVCLLQQLVEVVPAAHSSYT
jgi:hypothetical protein